MNHTRLWYLNAIVLQWFGVRLARVMDGDTQTGWTMVRRRPLTGWRGA